MDTPTMGTDLDDETFGIKSKDKIMFYEGEREKRRSDTFATFSSPPLTTLSIPHLWLHDLLPPILTLDTSSSDPHHSKISLNTEALPFYWTCQALYTTLANDKTIVTDPDVSFGQRGKNRFRNANTKTMLQSARVFVSVLAVVLARRIRLPFWTRSGMKNGGRLRYGSLPF